MLTMLRSILITTIMTTVSAIVSAQAPVGPAAATPSTLRLTVDDAVKMALDHNIDLAAERLDPQIGDARVSAATRSCRGSGRHTACPGARRTRTATAS